MYNWTCSHLAKYFVLHTFKKVPNREAQLHLANTFRISGRPTAEILWHMSISQPSGKEQNIWLSCSVNKLSYTCSCPATQHGSRSKENGCHSHPSSQEGRHSDTLPVTLKHNPLTIKKYGSHVNRHVQEVRGIKKKEDQSPQDPDEFNSWTHKIPNL